MRLARDGRESPRFSWMTVNWVTVCSLAAHVAAFAVSLGPIARLIRSEIHPLNVCGTAVGVATLSNWTVNLIIAMTFLPLIHGLGRPATFWLDAGPAVVAIVFTRLYVAGTRRVLGAGLSVLQDAHGRHRRRHSSGRADQARWRGWANGEGQWSDGVGMLHGR